MHDGLPLDLSNLLEDMERYAKERLREAAVLDPFGMTEAADRKRSLVLPFQAVDQVKGIPPNALVRMAQDAVFDPGAANPPALAGILFGADLVPEDGGDSGTALVAWLEQSLGLAALAITPFTIGQDGVVLGERQIAPKKPVVLAMRDAVSPPDIGCGRIGTFNIRPRVDFRTDADVSPEDAADLLLLLALDREAKEQDWEAVSAVPIDKNRFIFERICLRTTAVIISLVDIEEEGVLHTVEALFWDKMDRVSPHINGAAQGYFEAFRDSERAQGSKVFSEFSIRCFGAEQGDLVLFARKSFGMTLLVCREWLKKHNIKP